MDEKVLCPRCRSAQLHAEKRGWRLMTGFIGSSKIYITCLACGKKFRPGEGIRESDSKTPQQKAQQAEDTKDQPSDAKAQLSDAKAQEAQDTKVGCIALAVIGVVIFLLVKACG